MNFTAEIESKIAIIENIVQKCDRQHTILINVVIITIFAAIMCYVGYTVFHCGENKEKYKKKYKKWTYIEAIFSAIILSGIIYLNISIHDKENAIGNNVKELLETINQNEKCSLISAEEVNPKWLDGYSCLSITFDYGSSEISANYIICSLPQNTMEEAIKYTQILNSRKIICNDNSEVNAD